MSTQKGNIRKDGQKYQNAFAFKHNKNSMLTRKIQETPLDFLCEHCLDILEWKIKFRKYKPLSAPSKCIACEQKSVYKGHRNICDKCGVTNKLCTKCMKPCEAWGKPTRSSKVLRMKPKDTTFDDIVASLKERQRRTVLRKIEDGEDIVFDVEKGIINKYTGEIVFPLSELNNGVLCQDQDNEEGDEDEEIEEDEEEDKLEESKQGEEALNTAKEECQKN
jgi:hypothetical protein